MAGIGEKTVERIKEDLGDLIASYRTAIDGAYLAQKENLKVSLSVDLSPGKTPDEIIIESSISFATGKIKDKINSTVDERQGNLFDVLEKDPNVDSLSIDGHEVYRKGNQA